MVCLRDIAVSTAAVLALAADPARAAELAEVTVIVENLRSADGEVRVALWSRAEGFTESDSAVAKTDIKAEFGEVEVTFGGLPLGRYAVIGYHDENGNGDFDRTWLGLPKEGLGFSNGAWIGLGPPAFEEAAVEVTGPRHVVIVRLRY